MSVNVNWLRIATRLVFGCELGVEGLIEVFDTSKYTDRLVIFTCRSFQVLLLLNYFAFARFPLPWSIFSSKVSPLGFQESIFHLSEALLVGEGDICRHLSYIIGGPIKFYEPSQFDVYEWKGERIEKAFCDGMRLAWIVTYKSTDYSLLRTVAHSSPQMILQMIYTRFNIDKREIPIEDILGSVQSTTLKLLWRIAWIVEYDNVHMGILQEIEDMGFSADHRDLLFQWIRCVSLTAGIYINDYQDALGNPLVIQSILRKYGYNQIDPDPVLDQVTTFNQLVSLGFPIDLISLNIQKIGLDHAKVFFIMLFVLLTSQRDKELWGPFLSSQLSTVFIAWKEMRQYNYMKLGAVLLTSIIRIRKSKLRYYYLRLSAIIIESNLRRYFSLLRVQRNKLSAFNITATYRAVLRRRSYQVTMSRLLYKSIETLLSICSSLIVQRRFQQVGRSCVLIKCTFWRYQRIREFIAIKEAATAIQRLRFSICTRHLLRNGYRRLAAKLCSIWRMRDEGRITKCFQLSNLASRKMVLIFKRYKCRIRLEQYSYNRRIQAQHLIARGFCSHRTRLLYRQYKDAIFIIKGYFTRSKLQKRIHKRARSFLSQTLSSLMIRRQYTLQKPKPFKYESALRLLYQGSTLSQITMGCQVLVELIDAQPDIIKSMDLGQLCSRLVDLLTASNRSVPYVAMSRHIVPLLEKIPQDLVHNHSESLVSFLIAHKDVPDLLIDILMLLPESLLKESENRQLCLLRTYCRRKVDSTIIIRQRSGSTLPAGLIYRNCLDRLC